jgi:hypothetical protein
MIQNYSAPSGVRVRFTPSRPASPWTACAALATESLCRIGELHPELRGQSRREIERDGRSHDASSDGADQEVTSAGGL